REKTDWPKKFVFLSAKPGQLNSLNLLIEKVNDLGSNRIPFFLFVDFEMKRPLLAEPKDLSRESIFVSFPAFTNTSDSYQVKADTRIKKVTPPGITGYQKGF